MCLKYKISFSRPLKYIFKSDPYLSKNLELWVKVKVN